ncbi:MAG: tRNA pseudouridine(55) synthase TruB [Clostridia bacterium]|nr:tRNA pseudouridine(55) synthase TruB [Clostridia bacterium]
MSNPVLHTNGVLCVDKPAEMTSFLCCSIFRRLLGIQKIGHGGTLDPMATGVLPLLCGNATRAMDILPVKQKRYTASFRLGLVSDTQDVWGTVQGTGAPLPATNAVEAALMRFRGKIEQIPPMTSALKRDGVRLYELARQGVEVERAPRPITVHEMHLLTYDEQTGEGSFDCLVSAGTYVRTLCHDLGQALGTGAVMTALRRTMAAGYPLSDCLSLEDARAMTQEQLRARLQPTESAFAVYPSVSVTAAQATRFRNGGALALDRLPRDLPATSPVRVLAPDGAFLGLGQADGEELTILKLFPDNG